MEQDIVPYIRIIDGMVHSPSGFAFLPVCATKKPYRIDLIETETIKVVFYRIANGDIVFLPINSFSCSEDAKTSDFTEILDKLRNENGGAICFADTICQDNDRVLNGFGYHQKRVEKLCYISLPGTYEEWFLRKGVQRYNIRKGINEKLIVKKGGVEFLDVYYSLYKKSYDRWKTNERANAPALEKKYYQKLCDEFKDYNAIYLVYTPDMIPIAGAIISCLGKTASYTYGAFDSDYGALKPAYFLQAKVIEDLIKKSIGYYNMGLSGDLDGVERFKKNLGAITSSVYVYSRNGKLSDRIRNKIKKFF